MHDGLLNVKRSSQTGSTDLVGWTLESPGRGTLSLIVTCLITTALCTWIVIHPRIHKHKRLRLPHKAVLCLKAIVAPEFIAVEAAQEWIQARRVVRECSEFTTGGMQMVHAFYIGMFGVRYRVQQGTRVLWPNQFVWLLEQGLFKWEDHEAWGLSREAIKDKSNADGTAKVFAMVQIAWFVAQSIMRAAHNLPISPLESMTLSYIPLFIVTYSYWWIKPKDIETPSVVDLPAMTCEEEAEFDLLAVDNRFDDEEASAQKSLLSICWALTPRVFEKEAADNARRQQEEDHRAKCERYDEHHDVCSNEKCEEPDHQMPAPLEIRRETTVAHWDPQLYHSRILWPIACLAGISFPALHLISWNTVFPTEVESWLWRVSAITSIFSMLIFMQFEKIVVRWQDPMMLVKIVSPLLYLTTRMILLGGAFAALRACEPGTYDTFVASTYWVHLV